MRTLFNYNQDAGPRILHVVLTSIYPYPSPQAMPLAAAFLKAYLLKDPALAKAVNVSLTEFYLHQSAEECAVSLLKLNPGALGFSVYVWNRNRCLEIMAAVRKKAPEIILFAGGPETTADPHGLIESGEVDFVIPGEGESAFVEAMRTILHGGRVSGVFTSAPPTGTHLLSAAPESPELDHIPSPFCDGVLDLNRYDGVLWQLSRGCSFTCDFCFDHKGGGNVRRFSLDRVEADLQVMVAKGVSQVFVLDSTFNQDMGRAKKILRLIARLAPRIHFHFEVRSEFIDRELAGLFAGTTCSLQIGLQSSDPQVLRRVSRFFNPQDFSKRIDLLNRSGAIFGFDLIYGLPGDTYSGFVKSVNYALRLYPNHLDIFPLAVLPGTRLSEQPRNGLTHSPGPPYTVLYSPTFPKEDMMRAADLAAATDIFYSRGKAVAWFNLVITALDTTPAVFLEEFWQWLARKGTTGVESELEDQEVWLLQRDFLKFHLRKGKASILLSLVLDLVDYHYHYATVLMSSSPPPERLSPQVDPLKIRLQLAPAARLAIFSYDIEEALEAGTLNPFHFVKQFPRTGSRAAIFSDGHDIHTEVLAPPYFELLQQLNETDRPARGHGNTLPAPQVRKFLRWALFSGLVVEARQD